MRKSVIAGIFAYAIFFVSPKVSAEAASNEYLYAVSLASIKPAMLVVNEAQVVQVNDVNNGYQAQVVESTEEPEVIEYTVKQGDSLTTIANEFDTTWQRIFYKNTDINNPDAINPGDLLIMPRVDEQLAERELPQIVPPQPVQQVQKVRPKNAIKQSSSVATPTTGTDSAAGNRYTRGYCTWYVKNMRPDLPNNLGNAATWVTRAQAQGIATGSTARAGAVGQRGNHVVYVESVNGDGTITISEMNYQAWNQTSRRTVSENYFTYIY